MNGSRMQILRLTIVVVIFGCSVYSYLDAACTANCRTAFALANPANDCRVFEDKLLKTSTFHAYDSVTTYNQSNNEKQPAPKTGRTINLWSVTCTLTCGATELPQEVTANYNSKIALIYETDQRKCTAGRP